jgi:hypothetical protein
LVFVSFLLPTRALTRTSAGNKKYEYKYEGERDLSVHQTQGDTAGGLPGGVVLAVVGALRHGIRRYSGRSGGVKWFRLF